jgi:hypothetical protein
MRSPFLPCGERSGARVPRVGGGVLQLRLCGRAKTPTLSESIEKLFRRDAEIEGAKRGRVSDPGYNEPHMRRVALRSSLGSWLSAFSWLQLAANRFCTRRMLALQAFGQRPNGTAWQPVLPKSSRRKAPPSISYSLKDRELANCFASSQITAFVTF